MVPADLLIINAVILTLDSQNRRAGSLAVREGCITGIWSESEPLRHEVSITEKTKIVDLKGATLIPGFIDTHNHILGYSLMMNLVNCSTPANKNINDILERIRLKSEQIPVGTWVRGYGYDDTLLEDKRHPTRKEMDRVAPNHPVYISHISGHLAVANSLALELAGVDEEIFDSSDGHFGRDQNGRLNGVLFEKSAMDPITNVFPEDTEEEMIGLLSKASKEYLAQGITMNTDAAVGAFKNPTKELNVHLKAAKQGINPMRTRLMIMHTLLGENGMFSDYSAKRLDEEIRERSSGRVRLDSAKMFQDGSIQGLTGALREPYYSKPNEYGELFHNQQAFNEEILDLHKRGFRVAIHGNGDRAIASILEGYAFALEHVPRADHRHRIEHLQTATVEDLDKMKMLGVAGSFFINHVYYWGERHERLFLGQKRASRISPIRDAMERNLLFTIHSDCPVTPISPLFSVWAAVNRLTHEGRVLGAEQRCDVITALKSMTIYGARLNFDERTSGSIEIGKRADFAVLETDPTMIDPIGIKDISILATFIDGEIVYESGKSFVRIS